MTVINALALNSAPETRRGKSIAGNPETAQGTVHRESYLVETATLRNESPHDHLGDG